MSGQGRGFCVLKRSEAKPSQLQGFAGLQGVPIDHIGESLGKNSKKEVDMQFGEETDPAVLKPKQKKSSTFYTKYILPGYVDPAMARVGYYGPSGGQFRSFGLSSYSYGINYAMPYVSWINPWLRRGFGRKWGRRRGRFGYW
jgi:hypothetical protein